MTTDTQLTTTDSSLTVEQCLAELREMFPRLFGRITRQDNEHASAVYISLHRRESPASGLLVFTGVGSTLNEAMAQVRKWQQEQVK